MSQRYFGPAEYTSKTKPKTNQKNTKPNSKKTTFRGRGRVSIRVRFRFCLSGVLRWSKISLAHFSGRTLCYLEPSFWYSSGISCTL